MDDNTQKPQLPANLPMALDPETSKLPITEPQSGGFSRPTPPSLPPLPARSFNEGGSTPRPMTPPTPPVPQRPASFTPPTPPMPTIPTRPIPMPPPVRSFSEGGPSPKPSAPDVAVRSMKSDLEALKQSPSGMPIALAGQAKPITPPSVTGPIKIEAPKTKSKLLFIIIGVLVLGVIIALAGYFVIFPYFFPAQTLPSPITTTPAGNLTPTTPTTPSAAATHKSLLTAPANSQAPITLTGLDSFGVQQSLFAEANNRPAGNDVLKEIVVSDSNGQVAFADFLPLFLPEFTSVQLNALFENDFTVAMYYDANGFWPIYVSKLKSGADLTSAKNLMQGLETSANLTNLYLETPGTPMGSFKSGSLSGVATRYLPYSKTGASLNYAWVGDKLVISSSFNGLKRVLSSL